VGRESGIYAYISVVSSISMLQDILFVARTNNDINHYLNAVIIKDKSNPELIF
jgi:hypothetical protein